MKITTTFISLASLFNSIKLEILLISTSYSIGFDCNFDFTTPLTFFLHFVLFTFSIKKNRCVDENYHNFYKILFFLKIFIFFNILVFSTSKESSLENIEKLIKEKRLVLIDIF